MQNVESPGEAHVKESHRDGDNRAFKRHSLLKATIYKNQTYTVAQTYNDSSAQYICLLLSLPDGSRRNVAKFQTVKNYLRNPRLATRTVKQPSF
jgi:hypothetical protein